jgi:hypothetical protein
MLLVRIGTNGDGAVISVCAFRDGAWAERERADGVYTLHSAFRQNLL